ncbi:TPA: cytoplasmic protein [Bacillus cereus]|nr:cytoplasmic protein [Bacillus cereus]
MTVSIEHDALQWFKEELRIYHDNSSIQIRYSLRIVSVVKEDILFFVNVDDLLYFQNYDLVIGNHEETEEIQLIM